METQIDLEMLCTQQFRQVYISIPACMVYKHSVFTALMLGVVKPGRNSNYSCFAVLYTVSARIKVYCLNVLFNFYPLRDCTLFQGGSHFTRSSPGCGAINMSKLKAALSVRLATAQG